MTNIDQMSPRSGRVIREDGSIVNEANGINNDGSRNVVIVGGQTADDVTFINAVTAVTSGTPYTVGTRKRITIEIFGSATSATLAFMGRGPNDVDRAIFGTRLSDAEVASTGGMNELWTFDVTGLVKFTVNLTSVTGGNVSVKGKAV